MTRTSLWGRLAAPSIGRMGLVGLLAVLATLTFAGCERSQPGPKPISGTTATTAPGASGPTAPVPR